MKVQDRISLAVVVVCFMAAVVFYNQLPGRVAVHWNAQGEADGYAGKTWGLMLMPAVILFLYLFLLVIPKIEVYRRNIEESEPYYANFRLVFVLFLAGLYAATMVWNMGQHFNMGYYVLPALSVLFYQVSKLLKHVKRNFFIGVRTPWTLASEEVWDRTHALAERVFKAVAVITFAGLFFQPLGFWIMLAAVIGGAAYLIAYSYKIGKDVRL